MPTYYIVPTESRRPIQEFEAHSVADALDIGCRCGYPTFVVDHDMNYIGGEEIA